MKIKKLIALMLVVAMTITLFAACGKDDTTNSGNTGTNAGTSDTNKGNDANSGTTDNSGNNGGAASAAPIVIEVFDAAANYQGTQTGWYAQLIKEKFNIELSIIAPQVAGDSVYQTRASSGNLGDIILLDPTDFSDCVANGLVKDITAEYANAANLKAFDEQIQHYNKGLATNPNGGIYGIPCEMTNTSPTSITSDMIYSSPLMRWDLYTGIGSPEIKDLDGMIDVLKQMMDKYPTNEAGDPAYALSLWADWDGGDGMLGIANVVQLTTWYGEKIKGSAILKPDDTFTPLTDKTASYYKILKFLNDAYLAGIVDPDSGTQNWDSACAKMSAGQVYLMWYSWQTGFWNSQDRLQNGTAFTFIPVADQKYYADSDTYYGSGRIFGVGSGVSGEKYDVIMKFLDWYASPEGATYLHNGIEGFNYTVNADGTYTQINDNALMDNLPVPAEWGGAGYSDGMSAINQWIVASVSTNPNTGEPYAAQFWKSYKEATMTQMKKDWSAKFGAVDAVDYMKKNNVLLASPNVSVSLESDTADIGVIRNQCNNELCAASWRMIFASDDADFDAQWDELCTTLDGFGFQDLYNFDVKKHTVEVEAKKAAK